MDVICNTELGTTPDTNPLSGGLFQTDWSTHHRPGPGKGVGCFFNQRWQDRWLHIQEDLAPDQCRFYLVSAIDGKLLICVFYAPHQGHSMSHRVAFYSSLLAAVRKMTARFVSAPLILAGDANLPELEFNAQGVAVPHSSVTQLFCDQFLSWLECANTTKGKPVATQKRGGTLELVLHSRSLRLAWFVVDTIRFSGCDHFPVRAGFDWNYSPPPRGLLWVPNRAVTQQDFDAAMSNHWPSLHAWLAAEIPCTDGIPRKVEQLAAAAVILLCVVVLGTLWAIGSVFGRFAAPRAAIPMFPWWNMACKGALSKFRAARGSAQYKHTRKNFHQVLSKARVQHWRSFVSNCERLSKRKPVFDPKIHKVVRQGIRPALSSAATIRVGDQVLSEERARTLWPAFLHAQVSWHGP